MARHIMRTTQQAEVDPQDARDLMRNLDALVEGSLEQAMFILDNRETLQRLIDTARLQVSQASPQARKAVKEYLLGF